jgi:Acetyltransferase (GNAT) domain
VITQSSRSGGGCAAGAAPTMAGGATSAATEGPAQSTYFIDPLRDPRWASLVETHPDASVFHSTNWLRALQTVYGYEPVAISTCPPGSRLTNGLAFCRIDSWLTGRRMVSLPFSDHCEPLIDTPAQLDAMLEPMKEQVHQDDWKYLEIRPLKTEPGGTCGLRRLVTYHFHSLDLRPKTERLFQNFHRDCVQRKIRRAEREQLNYEEGTSEILIQKFYRLLVKTRRRQCLPPQPIRWFRGLVAAFGADVKIRVVSKNGAAIASILTLSHKKSMIYKYGCSDAPFNNLGGTALLFWKTIQEAKQRGFEEMELGRSDLNNAGLVAFKDRWSASRRSISYWTYPRFHASGPVALGKKLATRIVPMAPDLALEAVGNLLYKHIG